MKFGDRRDMALFDLLIGSINVCKYAGTREPAFPRAILALGYAAAGGAQEPDHFGWATPLSGHYHFIGGSQW